MSAKPAPEPREKTISPPAVRRAEAAPQVIAKPAPEPREKAISPPTVRRAETPKVIAKRAPEPREKAIAPSRPVSAEVARRHFLEILEAKQQRVRQGPSYPAPNAHTGRPADSGAPNPSAQDESESAVPPAKPGVKAT